jgi:hypothetical protein
MNKTLIGTVDSVFVMGHDPFCECLEDCPDFRGHIEMATEDGIIDVKVSDPKRYCQIAHSVKSSMPIALDVENLEGIFCLSPI